MPRISWMKAGGGIVLLGALGLAGFAIFSGDDRAAIASIVVLVVLALAVSFLTYRRSGMLLLRAEHLVAQGDLIAKEIARASQRQQRDAQHQRDALADISKGAIIELKQIALRAYQEHDSALREHGDLLGQASGSIAALQSRVEPLASQVKAMHGPLENLPSRFLADAMALDRFRTLFEPRAGLPVPGGWGMDPIALVDLVERIMAKPGCRVLELGSGASTVWLGYAVEHAGGRLHSVEHLELYAGQTRAMLGAHSLQGHVDLVLAPLEAMHGDGAQWYGLDRLATIDRIDVLLVDGPPRATGSQARWPALGVLFERLAPGALIIVDDVNRKEERLMVEHWTTEFGLREIARSGRRTVVLERAENDAD